MIWRPTCRSCTSGISCRSVRFTQQQGGREPDHDRTISEATAMPSEPVAAPEPHHARPCRAVGPGSKPLPAPPDQLADPTSNRCSARMPPLWRRSPAAPTTPSRSGASRSSCTGCRATKARSAVAVEAMSVRGPPEHMRLLTRCGCWQARYAARCDSVSQPTTWRRQRR